VCEGVVCEPPWVAVVGFEWGAFGDDLCERVHGIVLCLEVDVELLVLEGEMDAECCDGSLVVVEEGCEEGRGCKGSECQVCGGLWWW